MNWFKKELNKMAKFLDDLNKKIANIHTTGGVTDAQVTADVQAAISSSVSDLTGRINDLEAALTNVVDHLQQDNPDTDAAIAAAKAAQSGLDNGPETAADDGSAR